MSRVRMDWQQLERDLRELEEGDPAVKAARKRVDHLTSEHERWRRAMVRSIWGEGSA